MGLLLQRIGGCVLAGLIVAGCADNQTNSRSDEGAPSTSDSDSPTTTHNSLPDPDPSSVPPPDQAALDDFEQVLSSLGLAGTSESRANLAITDLYEQGEEFCRTLDSERGFIAASAVFPQNDLSQDEIGALVFAAIEGICPRHSNVLDELLGAVEQTTEEQFISTVRLYVGGAFVDAIGPEALIELAQRSCERISAGETALEVFEQLAADESVQDVEDDGNFTAVEQVIVSLGIGVGAFCPDQLEEVQDQLQG